MENGGDLTDNESEDSFVDFIIIIYYYGTTSAIIKLNEKLLFYQF